MSRPRPVTPVQRLAVLAIWALAAYGVTAKPRPELATEPVRLIACR